MKTSHPAHWRSYVDPLALVPGVASAGMDARRIGGRSAIRRPGFGRTVANRRPLRLELEQSRLRHHRRSATGLPRQPPRPPHVARSKVPTPRCARRANRTTGQALLVEAVAAAALVASLELWTARYKSVCVVATFQTTGRRDPELETLATMIMNSLEFADEPPDPPHIFADRVVRIARDRFPSLQVPSQRRISRAVRRIEHQPVQLLPHYVQEPDRFEDIILPALATVAQVQKWDSAQSEPTLASVRGRILADALSRGSLAAKLSRISSALPGSAT